MKEINDILNEFTEDYGFCKFEKAEPYLLECSAKKRIPQNAKTVIVFVFPYYMGEDKYENLNVSRYAAVPDYHGVVNEFLRKITERLSSEFPEEEFVCFTDNSPIPEVRTASEAGLGKVGRNGLLINEKYGSWVFIGEIVTTLDTAAKSVGITYCENCGKCVEACPVGALSEENFDKNICLSNVSQKKGEIDEKYKSLMIKYSCAWGCDICQQVCPHNKKVTPSNIEEFIEGLISHVEEDCDINGRAFAWRGEKVIKRNLVIIKGKS